MNDFQKSLDRYLTTEPEDGFTDWYERTLEAIPDNTYDKHSEWFEDQKGLCDKLLNPMVDNGLTPGEGTNILTLLFSPGNSVGA